MTTLHAALALVTKANGFPGLGFKSAAKIAGIPRSAMRPARWRLQGRVPGGIPTAPAPE